jgi:hypothetical protein
VRLLAERMRDQLGQPFVVENRSGAGGNIGIDAAAKAAPDGYTVGAATLGQFSINQYLYRRMPFDPERDLQPVSLTWELPNVAVVASDKVPARTLAEFVAWAKARPTSINLGSPGVGTSPHLSGELFGVRAGVAITHVPFRGAAQTLPGAARRRRGLRDRQPRLLHPRHPAGSTPCPGGHPRPNAGRSCQTSRRWRRPGCRTSWSRAGRVGSSRSERLRPSWIGWPTRSGNSPPTRTCSSGS